MSVTEAPVNDLPLAAGAVAVVTGAALGIGRALSQRLASAGLSVVMADLPGADLDDAVLQVAQAADPACKVLAVPTDVSMPEQIERLHDQTLAAFGQVDLLVNNAVTRAGRGIDANIDEWQRAMQVNLWGPVNSVRAFLPAMLQSPARGFIVNVGSKQGITNPPGHPIYNMSKSALKTYTEALEHDLRTNSVNQVAGSRVSAHLLVPGWTTTGKSEHKPGAWLATQVVDMLLAALLRGDFYIVCPDGQISSAMDRRRILWGAGDITENRPPLSRWHPDFAVAASLECDRD